VREARDLLREVLLHDVGSRLTLSVMRGGHAQNVTMLAQERPGHEREGAPQVQNDRGGAPLDGLSMRALSDRERRAIGSAGAVITQMQPGTDADRAGLEPGDVIVEADGHRVQSPTEVEQALRDGSALLRVRRGEGAMYTILHD
jgi:serine protease Do